MSKLTLDQYLMEDIKQSKIRKPISVTICKDKMGWLITGKADGRVFKTHSQSENGAIDHAHQWLSLWENGELY